MNPIFSIVTLAVLVALIDLPYLLLNANKYATITKSISGAGYTDRYYSVALVYIAIASGLYFLVLPQIKIIAAILIAFPIQTVFTGLLIKFIVSLDSLECTAISFNS